MAELIRLVTTYPDPLVEGLLGRYPESRHYVRVIGERDADVLKPDGSLLLSFRREVLPTWICHAFEPMKRAAQPTNRRPRAQGDAKVFRSGTLGCLRGKLTATTSEDRDGWYKVQPLLRATNDVFRSECPDQHAHLLEAAGRAQPSCVIPDTAFTTVAANRNARMATHRDSGNLPGAYGVLTALRAGEYRGGLLVFPKFRVAVDLKYRDVLIADNREAHGNTAIEGTAGEFERVTAVAYFHASNLARSG